MASRSLTDADVVWNTERLSADDALGDIARLRQQDGGDLITWGSVSLVKAMLGAGLVDELTVMIEPIILGGGKRIFPDDGVARPMQLVQCVGTSTGVQVCTYRPG